MDQMPTYEELVRLVEDLQKKADRADEYYKSLFENSHTIKLIIAPENGQILDANLSACRFYGYTKEQLKSLKITDINILSEEEVFLEMQHARLEQRNYFLFRHRLANGMIKDVEAFSGPIIFFGRKVLYSIIHDISEKKQLESEKERLNASLETAIEEIKTLKGILPICASCKKIRNDKGYWEQIEAYISDHSDAEFSHSICPDCIKKLYPDFKMPDG
jgi:PAS domain S-box-containing protein